MDNSRLYLKTLIISVASFLGVMSVYLFTPTIHQPEGVVFYLKPGTSKKVLIAQLAEQHIIRMPMLLSLYTFPQKNSLLKTGEYHFPKNSSAYSIWRQVTTGKGLLYRPFTIVPGWSFQQLRRELLRTLGLKHMTAKLDDKQVMQLMSGEQKAPEGQFFPETYYYTRGISDLVILKRAFNLMKSRLEEAWEKRASNLPYKSAYEALIAASMIEKEAFLEAERPLIAGVLINRLKKDMLLQFDPTVIYGLGERYTGKIHKQNLIEDTPYNTYLHKGLPPTPISMPSMGSIVAALHPQVSDYLYFVAKGDGSHQFSNSLLEHHVAVTTATTTIIKQEEPVFNEKFIHNYLHPHDNDTLKKVRSSQANH